MRVSVQFYWCVCAMVKLTMLNQYLCTSFHVMYYISYCCLSLLLIFLTVSPVKSLCFRFFWCRRGSSQKIDLIRTSACVRWARDAHTAYICHNLHTVWCMISTSIFIIKWQKWCCGTCIERISMQICTIEFFFVCDLRLVVWCITNYTTCSHLISFK